MGEVLARLHLLPQQRWTPTSLAAHTRVSLPTVTREADRVVAAGLVLEERVGRTRRLRCHQAAATFEPLSRLLALTYGPAPVLEPELDGLPGVDRADVYGSWAARHRAGPGPEPGDADVLVVGDPDPHPDPHDVFEVAERARTRLLREVDVRTTSPQAWERAQHAPARDTLDGPAGADPFLHHVRSSPLVTLHIDAHDTDDEER